jgi:CHAT domain-containing protein
LAGIQATAEAVKAYADDVSHLHFACHGSFDVAEPNRSALHLASGALTLADVVSKLDLRKCELVVLSACETGITDLRRAPDEFIGFPAAFLQAGAAGIVSSLWPVGDLATMLLMAKFYEFAVKQGTSEPEALRRAQMWLRNVDRTELHRVGTTLGAALGPFLDAEAKDHPFANPHHWAAFTLTGIGAGG